MDSELLTKLTTEFPYLSERDSADHVAVNCPIDKVIELITAVKNDFGFDMLLDVTAIDWLDASPRFTGLWHFYSTSSHQYLRIASDLADDENPSAPSLCDLYPAANWHERECWDLLGVKFVGHPDLRRILMWEGYPYHPLRKDFPLAGLDTELPDPEITEETGTPVIAAPMMGGPFRADKPGPTSDKEPRGADQSWDEKNEKPQS